MCGDNAPTVLTITLVACIGVFSPQRCPLDILVLKAKLLDKGEPKAILGRALDPPMIDDVERTVLELKEASMEHGSFACLLFSSVIFHGRIIYVRRRCKLYY